MKFVQIHIMTVCLFLWERLKEAWTDINGDFIGILLPWLYIIHLYADIISSEITILYLILIIAVPLRISAWEQYRFILVARVMFKFISLLHYFQDYYTYYYLFTTLVCQNAITTKKLITVVTTHRSSPTHSSTYLRRTNYIIRSVLNVSRYVTFMIYRKK